MDGEGLKFEFMWILSCARLTVVCRGGSEHWLGEHVDMDCVTMLLCQHFGCFFRKSDEIERFSFKMLTPARVFAIRVNISDLP